MLGAREANFLTLKISQSWQGGKFIDSCCEGPGLLMWTVGTDETKGKEVHISGSNMMGRYSHLFPHKIPAAQQSGSHYPVS